MEGMFTATLSLSLFAVPIIVGLWAASAFLRKRYGARRLSLLWLVLAVRLCVPVSLELPAAWQGARVEVPAVSAVAQGVRAAVQTLPQNETIVQPQSPAVPETTPTIPTAESAAFSMGDAAAWLLRYLWVVWLVGALVFLAWQLGRYAAFLRMLKRERRDVRDAGLAAAYDGLCREMGFATAPRLYVCAGLRSPLCVGFFRQAVYLPAETGDPADLSFILRHELTHCKRRDVWYKGVLLLARALHFFNPFVHGMARLAERELEISCDLAVMEKSSMAEREGYTMAILRTVREGNRRREGLSTAFWGGKEELRMRFETIFDRSAKKRGTALFLAVLLLLTCGTAFVGCAAEEARTETESTVLYGAYTTQTADDLFAAKLAYIGDNVGVARILGLFPLPDGVTPHAEGVELYTDEPAFGARYHLAWAETAETTYTHAGETKRDDRWSRIHALLFLALVENADFYEETLHTENGAETFTFDRAAAETYFGETDLRLFAQDAETFRAFVRAINQYFYANADTAEEIEALLSRDAAEAQAKMAALLAGDTEGTLYEQMMQAESLADALAAAGETDTEALREDDRFLALVALGEPALQAFLVDFAAGTVRDDWAGQVKMLACRTVLGDTAETDLSPTAWYATVYTATDSQYCPPFFYDAAVYTVDLARDTALDGTAAQEWSVVAAGDDVRLQAVYQALTQQFSDSGAAGQRVRFFAPYVVEMEETADTLSVYCVLREGVYVRTHTPQSGYALFEEGGANIPCRMDFVKRGGDWVFTALQQPQDGTAYTSSILAFCEGDEALADALLAVDPNEVERLLWQNILYYLRANFADTRAMPLYIHTFVEADTLREVQRFADVILLNETI